LVNFAPQLLFFQQLYHSAISVSVGGHWSGSSYFVTLYLCIQCTKLIKTSALTAQNQTTYAVSAIALDPLSLGLMNPIGETDCME